MMRGVPSALAFSYIAVGDELEMSLPQSDAVETVAKERSGLLTDEGSVLVVCAMDSEAVHLRTMLDQVEEAPIARWRRSRGMIDNVAVDLVVCGIGLAYSAAATSAALIDTRPTAILNYGCAGAHRADIHAGDVIVGEFRRSPRFLRASARWNEASLRLSIRRGRQEIPITFDQLPTDRMLVECARQAAEVTELPSWPGAAGDPTIHFGPVGSADIWTQHIETIQFHHATHGTLCEDMEAAAIAQIAALFGVPFLTIKDISNNELQKATAFEGADSGAGLLDDVVDQVGLRAAMLAAAAIQRFGEIDELRTGPCADLCTGRRPMADQLVEAGFAEGTPNRHPGQGTANRRFFFDNAFIEFIWVADEAEIRSDLVAPTRLWERMNWRESGASPFEICIRPVGDQPGEIPFSTFSYRPPYLPPGDEIPMADQVPVEEPGSFVNLAGKAPARNLANVQPLDHPNGARNIKQSD